MTSYYKVHIELKPNAKCEMVVRLYDSQLCYGDAIMTRNMQMHPTFRERLADELWEAVAKGDTALVNSLLDQGVDPNHEIYWSKEWLSKSTNLWTIRYPLLHTACANGNLSMVKVLIQRGADPDRGDPSCNLTPLQQACTMGKRKVAEYLSKEAKCKLVGELVALSYSCKQTLSLTLEYK